MHALFEAALAKFKFLETEFGYVARDAFVDDVRVRYEGPRAWFECFHDPRGEVSASLGRNPWSSENRLMISTIAVRLGLPPPEDIYSSDVTPVDQVLERVAEFLRKYCRPWLTGDEDAFSELMSYQSVSWGLHTQDYTREARPPELWIPVMEAWTSQQLRRLARLIQELPSPLTRWEIRALEYCHERAERED